MKFPLETSISRKFCGTFMMPRMINLFRVMRGFTSHTSKYPNGGEVKYRERQRNLFWRLFHRKVHSFNLTHFVLPSSLRSMMFLPSSRSITSRGLSRGFSLFSWCTPALSHVRLTGGVLRHEFLQDFWRITYFLPTHCELIIWAVWFLCLYIFISLKIYINM